jgi:hypothetical protein
MVKEVMASKEPDWNKDVAGKVLAAWKACAGARSDDIAKGHYEPSISATFHHYLANTEWPDGLEAAPEYAFMNGKMTRVAKKIMFGDKEGEIRPDIIIHRPYENSLQGNLLFIEIKRFENKYLSRDRFKLIEVTSRPQWPRPFQYRFGLLLRYRRSGEIGRATLYRENSIDDLIQATLLLHDLYS